MSLAPRRNVTGLDCALFLCGSFVLCQFVFMWFRGRSGTAAWSRPNLHSRLLVLHAALKPERSEEMPTARIHLRSHPVTVSRLNCAQPQLDWNTTPVYELLRCSLKHRRVETGPECLGFKESVPAAAGRVLFSIIAARQGDFYPPRDNILHSKALIKLSVSLSDCSRFRFELGLVFLWNNSKERCPR